MLKAVTSRRSRRSGVTLIELLLCVGLIGMIAALAMPFYSSADNARHTKDRRNAQTFCSVYTIVQAAGISVATQVDAEDGEVLAEEEIKERDEAIKMEILEALREGITVNNGPLRGRTFRVPNLQDEEVTAASRYLRLQDGKLIYNANLQDG